MTIWKFNLAATERQDLEMPSRAKILFVGAQDPTGHTVQLWAEVNPDAERETRRFAIAGTGHPLPPAGHHLGSVITAGGALVWHVYEVRQ